MSSRIPALNSLLSARVPAPVTLSEELVERVLARLGFRRRPESTLESLSSLYASWGRRVPFDNVCKLIHVRAGNTGPLPGSTAADFFNTWLKHGTGGTCWSGSEALHALLVSLGFDAVRGVATMLVTKDMPPNHGSTMVRFGAERYVVDSSMLYGAPLLLAEHETSISHPSWGVQCRRKDGRWNITWRPLHKTDGFECRFESFGATAAGYQRYYERTRGWSPFNYEVNARINRGDSVTGLAFGREVTLHADGRVSNAPVSHAERVRALVEDIGLSEEIVSALPRDLPTPPPQGSRSALLFAAKP